MTRLGGPTTGSTWRLSAGTALVSGGLLTAGLGAANVFHSLLLAAGVTADLAWWLGVGGAALLIPVLITAIGTRLHTPTPYRRGLHIGVALAAIGVPIVVTTATTATPPAVMLAAIPYAGGVVLALWSLVAGAASAPRPTPSVAYESGSSSTDPHPSAADGGEDDDLAFPLDDEH